jgi:hypothetical protein
MIREFAQELFGTAGVDHVRVEAMTGGLEGRGLSNKTALL